MIASYGRPTAPNHVKSMPDRVFDFLLKRLCDSFERAGVIAITVIAFAQQGRISSQPRDQFSVFLLQGYYLSNVDRGFSIKDLGARCTHASIPENQRQGDVEIVPASNDSVVYIREKIGRAADECATGEAPVLKSLPNIPHPRVSQLASIQFRQAPPIGPHMIGLPLQRGRHPIGDVEIISHLASISSFQPRSCV